MLGTHITEMAIPLAHRQTKKVTSRPRPGTRRSSKHLALSGLLRVPFWSPMRYLEWSLCGHCSRVTVLDATHREALAGGGVRNKFISIGTQSDGGRVVTAVRSKHCVLGLLSSGY